MDVNVPYFDESESWRRFRNGAPFDCQENIFGESSQQLDFSHNSLRSMASAKSSLERWHL